MARSDPAVIGQPGPVMATPKAPQPPSAREPHTHLIRSDVPVRVTVEPADSPGTPPAKGEPWFRLFRSVVHSGLWAELTPASAKVLIVLAECVNDKRRGDEGRWFAWPSVATIGERAGLGRRAVQKALGDLETRGLIDRCRRRTAKRGDFSSEYELHPPARAANDDAQEGAHDDAHPPAHEATPAPAADAAPAGRGGARGAGAAACAQQSKTQPENDQTDMGAAVDGSNEDPPKPRGERERSPGSEGQGASDPGDRFAHPTASGDEREDDAARVALVEAGVSASMAAKLLASAGAAEVRLRVGDWRRRRGLGQRIGPAWLIASIRDGYDLHEATLAEAERARRAEAAESHRTAEAADRAAADAESARLDAAAAELLAAMSDEELGHWKRQVLAAFPSLSRNLADADPRTDVRLRTLIQAKLVHLVA